MLKSFMLLSAAMLFALTPTSSSGSMSQEGGHKDKEASAAQSAKNSAKAAAATEARAKEIYGFDCAVCHGDNGDGKTDLAKSMSLTLADWTNPKSLAGKTDKELFDIIRKGSEKMPPEVEGRAKDEELWNLIHYLRSLAKAQPGAPEAPAAPAEPAAPAAPAAPAPPAN
jgi:mono/diheme cytochrome c family protein